MPPGQGTGKKGGSNLSRQRSRNTTPSSVAAPPPVAATASLPEITTIDLQYLDLKFEVFDNLTYDDLVDAGSGTGSTLPDSRSLDGIISRLKRLQGIADDRGSSYDRGMRLLSQSRRARMDQVAADRSREEERIQREATDEDHQRRANKKKRKAPSGDSQSQDAASASASASHGTPGTMDVDDKDKASKDKDGKSAPGDDKDKANANASASESESSDDEGAPPPRPVPQNQTFGEDPSTFPDPTVYEIRPVTPGMSVDEIKEIYSVASYPPSDLADLIAGNPPDKDFSSAKPSNQINFSTFSTYIEPYFRPFTEEDLAFLRERGNRLSPFSMPKRGKRHYTEIWAEEDGAMAIDSTPPASASTHDKQLPPNQPRGSIETMTDDIGETDKLSVGPLLARLMQAMRPEHRAPDAGGAGAGGDTSMNGDVSMNGDLNDGPGGGADGDRSWPPATFMPESSSESWKKTTHPKLEYSQVDERIKQELRHIGFLPFPDPSSSASAVAANGVAHGSSANGAVGAAGATANGTSASNGANGSAAGAASGSNTNGAAAATTTTTTGGDVDPSLAADYNGHFDDEIAARLRRLQAGLREQMLINGARKARLADLVKERMAYQEYQTILEDLDGQVQGAYLKRTRTMGKSKKGKRPGGGAAAGAGAAGAAGAGAAGMARPGIGDMTRTLMERRKRWMENIGTVFDDERLQRVPRSKDPNSSIFQPSEMAGLLKREKAAWDEEVDEE